MHGLAEHSGRYGEFANFFADAWIATYALDHPGHGRSDGKYAHIGEFQEYTDAVAQLLVLAQKEHPDIPFVSTRLWDICTTVVLRTTEFDFSG